MDSVDSMDRPRLSPHFPKASQFLPNLNRFLRPDQTFRQIYKPKNGGLGFGGGLVTYTPNSFPIV